LIGYFNKKLGFLNYLIKIACQEIIRQKLENVVSPPSAVLPQLKPEFRRAMVPAPDGRQAGFILP